MLTTTEICTEIEHCLRDIEEGFFICPAIGNYHIKEKFTEYFHPEDVTTLAPWFEYETINMYNCTTEHGKHERYIALLLLKEILLDELESGQI